MKTIKFYVALISILLSLQSGNIYAKKIIIRKEGSPDGIHYDRVRETHNNPIIGDDVHRLICLGGGSIECKWEHSPWIVGNTNTWDYYEFISIFENKIKNHFADNSVTTYFERFNIDGIEVVIDATRNDGEIVNYTITIEDKE